MRLSEFLETRGITQTDFASRIERSIASVSRLCAGLQKPDLDTLLSIERETGGLVVTRDFAPQDDSGQSPDAGAESSPVAKGEAA